MWLNAFLSFKSLYLILIGDMIIFMWISAVIIALDTSYLIIGSWWFQLAHFKCRFYSWLTIARKNFTSKKSAPATANNDFKTPRTGIERITRPCDPKNVQGSEIYSYASLAALREIIAGPTKMGQLPSACEREDLTHVVGERDRGLNSFRWRHEGFNGPVRFLFASIVLGADAVSLYRRRVESVMCLLSYFSVLFCKIRLGGNERNETDCFDLVAVYFVIISGRRSMRLMSSLCFPQFARPLSIDRAAAMFPRRCL